MSTSTVPYRPCPHGLDPFGCPACVDEMHDTHLADRLSMHDPEAHQAWLADSEARSGSMDALRAEFGDIVPAIAPEVIP